MVERENHPSFLELDRFVLGAHRSASTQDHLQTCEQCASYVERITADRPVPEWVTNLRDDEPWGELDSPVTRMMAWRSRRRRRRRGRRVTEELAQRKNRGWEPSAAGGWMPESLETRELGPFAGWKWMGSFAGAAAVVGLVVLLAITPAHQEEAGRDGITAKGTPAVGVYVKRDGRVSLWDGRARVLAGDTLRLKVVPVDFSHITVLSRQDDSDAATLGRLHEAPVTPGQETVLSVAWRVDAQPGSEEIVVVLSHEPLHRDLTLTLAKIHARSRESQNLWSTRLVLMKGTASEE